MALTAAIGRAILMRSGTLGITANEAIECGDLVTAGGYLADGDNSRYADFIACQDAASGATMQVAREAVFEGFSGGAGAGTQLFLSDDAGDVSESVGTVPQLVGVELSATSAFLCPAGNRSAAFGSPARNPSSAYQASSPLPLPAASRSAGISPETC